jgi:hypothetical protein
MPENCDRTIKRPLTNCGGGVTDRRTCGGSCHPNQGRACCRLSSAKTRIDLCQAKTIERTSNQSQTKIDMVSHFSAVYTETTTVVAENASPPAKRYFCLNDG